MTTHDERITTMKTNRTVHRLGGTWGHHIEWLAVGSRIAGHLTPLPKKGDLLEVKMESGRTAHYKLTKVEPCHDPRDMFFADVEKKCYVAEGTVA